MCYPKKIKKLIEVAKASQKSEATMRSIWLWMNDFHNKKYDLQLFEASKNEDLPEEMREKISQLRAWLTEVSDIHGKIAKRSRSDDFTVFTAIYHLKKGDIIKVDRTKAVNSRQPFVICKITDVIMRCYHWEENKSGPVDFHLVGARMRKDGTFTSIEAQCVNFHSWETIHQSKAWERLDSLPSEEATTLVKIHLGNEEALEEGYKLAEKLRGDYIE